MKRARTVSALGAAGVFGALAMAAQMLLLRRFLWCADAAEAGVALFFASWLFWSGMGAASASTRVGRRVTGVVSRAVWLPVLACAGLYFAQYAIFANLRVWAGVPVYQQFPLGRLVCGCLLANAPFCFAAGFVIPSVCRRLADGGVSVSRAFAWEALGAAAGGTLLTVLLVRGVAPDPRDEAEWKRYFPQAVEPPGRFETGGGTTFYGTHGGTFYALSSSGVCETIPEGGRAVELALLVLSQRPYAKDVVLLGKVPLAVGLALESIRPDLSIVWCPCDALYGLRVLAAVRGSGMTTGVRACGETPQKFLESRAGGVADVILVVPPAATTLEGASWRQEAFAKRVRSRVRRSGVALFGLDCEAAAPTQERLALLDVSARSIRHAWPESGVFAAGAGGWWIAAQVPRLAYVADDAVSRFAMLKRDAYPSEAVFRLYDPERGKKMAALCPALNPDESVTPVLGAGLEETLALGLADAVRRAYPGVTPGVWLASIRAENIARLAGLLLVVLWMAPVVCGTGSRSRLRMCGAWVAACGALGLTASLAVLYRLQLGFGSLYLLAGAGSCLYLAGLFCGNRLSDAVMEGLRFRPRLLNVSLFAVTLAEAVVAVGVAAAAGYAVTETGLILCCFAVGCAAGAAVPVALRVCGAQAAESVPVCVFSDAMGAAVAGLAFVALVPVAGLVETVGCFAALVCGVAVCAAACGAHARLAAGLALFSALLALGGHFRGLGADGERAGVSVGPVVEEARAAAVPAAERRADLPGVPRRLDVPRIRELMLKGQLATNTAVFWE